MDIAVIGSNNVDLITYIDRMPAQGETLEAPDFQMGCGGKGANQAVACARLGAPVIMIGQVGQDSFGQTLREGLAADGIDAIQVGIDAVEHRFDAVIFRERLAFKNTHSSSSLAP